MDKTRMVIATANLKNGEEITLELDEHGRTLRMIRKPMMIHFDSLEELTDLLAVMPKAVRRWKSLQP